MATTRVLSLKIGSHHVEGAQATYKDGEVIIDLLQVIHDNAAQRTTIHSALWVKDTFILHKQGNLMVNGQTPVRLSTIPSEVSAEKMKNYIIPIIGKGGFFEYDSDGLLEVRSIAEPIFLQDIDKNRPPVITTEIVDGEEVTTTTPIKIEDNWEFIDLVY